MYMDLKRNEDILCPTTDVAGVLFCVLTLTVQQHKVVHVVTFVQRTVSALIVSVKAFLTNYL